MLFRSGRRSQVFPEWGRRRFRRFLPCFVSCEREEYLTRIFSLRQVCKVSEILM